MAKIWGVLLLILYGDPWVLGGLTFVAVAWSIDRITLQALPHPIRRYRRRQRISTLRRKLDINPHDRPARFELAEYLVDDGKGSEPLELVEANIQAGDQDAEHHLLAARAAARRGRPEDIEVAENHFAAAIEKDAGFRGGAIPLALGRMRARGPDPTSATDPLEQVLHHRPGSVEARLVLVQVATAAGDTVTADKHRATALQLFAEAPKFERRKHRAFAWKIAPALRAKYLAVTFGGAAAAAAAVFVFFGAL